MNLNMKHLFFLVFTLFSCGNILSAQNDMFDVCPLKVGENVPEVTVADQDNKSLLLSEVTKEQASVLIFYRGAWCGYCTQHLAELNDIKTEVEALGFKMMGITVDAVEKLEESTARSESEITVYSDAELAAITAFGLDWKVGDELFNKYKNDYKLDLEAWSGEEHHGLPVPAIFVVKDGIVQFQYVNPNYRVRLKAETLLAVLKTL